MSNISWILPPNLSEPPADLEGRLAFCPTAGKTWMRIDGKWVPLTEAIEKEAQMTAVPNYSTGTVTDGGTTVTGTTTIWSGVNARPGDVLQIGEFQTIISDVTDVTHLVIPPWGGGAQTDVAYKIYQVSPQRFAGAQAMADVATLVAALNTNGFFWFVDTDETEPDPSLGEDGQYAMQPSTGKVWLKDGGTWELQGVCKPFGIPAPYDNDATYSLNDVATSGGSSYVWINPTPGSGHAPPNVTYWAVLAAKGDTGAGGSQGAAGAGYGGTSTTSLTIGTGSKVFTTQAGLAYQNGARVRASSAANAANWMEGTVTYSGTTLTMTSDKVGGSGTLADWNLNVTGEPGAVPAVGQCILSKVSTNLVLSPKNGNLLTVGGVQCTVPDAGVSLAATGLTPGTLYYIYATQSGGVVNALEASTTGYVVSTTAGNKGVSIKNGDDARTLVGMARPITGPAWQDTATQRFVRSRFNDPGIVGKTSNVSVLSLGNATNVEISTSLRVEFLSWSGEIVSQKVTGYGYNTTAGQSMVCSPGFNSSVETTGSERFDSFTASISASTAIGAMCDKNDLSEGYNFATVFYSNSGGAGTANWVLANQLMAKQ